MADKKDKNNKKDMFAPPTEVELFAPPTEEELFAPPEEESGFFEGIGESALEGLEWAGEKYEKYLDAPGRAGVSSALESGDPLEYFGAFKEQFGEDPSEVPSYEDIAGQMGVPEEGQIPHGAIESKYGREIKPEGVFEAEPRKAVGLGLSLVGSDPVSTSLNLPTKVVKPLYSAVKKGAVEIAKSPVTIPWFIMKNVSGIDQKALKVYMQNLEKVESYIDTYGLDGIKELSKTMRERFNIRIDRFRQNMNSTIEQYLSKKKNTDVNIAGVFGTIDSMIAKLDDVAHLEEKKYLMNIRKRYMQYFDRPAQQPDGSWISVQSGDEVDVLFEGPNKSIPTSMVKKIGPEPDDVIVINLKNARVGDKFMVDAQTAYNVKKKLQDLSYGIGEKEGWIVETGPVKAALRAASRSARSALHKKIPEIALADTALSKIHLAQGLVKKGLVDPKSPEHALIAAGREGGGYDRKILIAMEDMLNNPKNADEIEAFKDAMTKQINQLKETNQLEAYAMDLGVDVEDLKAFAKDPMPQAVKEGIDMRGIPETQGFGVSDPSSSLAKESELLHATKTMAEAEGQFMPKGGPFLGAGTFAFGTAVGDPLKGIAMGLLFTAMSPASIKRTAKMGAKIPIQAGKMTDAAIQMGVKVKDGMAELTPDLVHKVMQNIVGTPIKKGEFMIKKTSEILQSPGGQEALMDALRAVMAGERLNLNLDSIKITEPDQARSYIKDIQKEHKMSNIEKFKRIQKANKERYATVDSDEIMAEEMPDKQAVMPQDVFKVLKGGA